MKKTQCAAVLAMTVCGLLPMGLAQSNATDAPTLQNILQELKAIHEDLRVNESSEILLTEWQLQQAQVNVATGLRDNVRAKLTEIQNEETQNKSAAARIEDALAAPTLDTNRKNQLLDLQQQTKAQLGALRGKEETLSSDLVDAEAKLREEQNKLDEIQGQLDTIMQQLRSRPRS